MSQIKVGQRVIVGGSKDGYIRFFGETEFAPGEWVGIELLKPEGKNNGTVQGKEYFTCAENYGLFVRKFQVKPVEEKPSTPKTTSNLPESRIRRLSGTGSISNKRHSEVGASSYSSKPPPPISTNTRQANRRMTMSPSSTLGLKKPSPLSRPSSTPESSEELKQAGLEIERLKDELKTKNDEISRMQSDLESSQSIQEASTIPEESTEDRVLQVKHDYDEKISKIREEASRLSKDMKQEYFEEMTTLREEFANERKSLQEENKELSIKIRGLESELVTYKSRHSQVAENEHKRAEDLVQANAKASAAIRKQEELQKQIVELQDMVEMLTLDNETLETDKEIAEERAEALESELNNLRVSAALDNTTSSTEESSEVSLSSLQEENQKLRTAIKNYHDNVSEEKNARSKQIRGLERELQELSPLKEEVKALKETKSKNEAEITELKEMLDVANAYESMVEYLTQKNLELGDKNADLEAANTSLEELNKVSEEMEIERQEYEEELQEELKQKHSHILELSNSIQEHATIIEDKERTILQFRELVQRNRNEISQLKQKLSSESVELAEVRGKTQARLNEAMVLRSSVANSRRLLIENSLKQLDVDQMHIEVLNWKALLPENLLKQYEQNMRARLLLYRVEKKLEFTQDQVRKHASNTLSIQEELQESKNIFEEGVNKQGWVKAIENNYEKFHQSIYLIRVSKGIAWLLLHSRLIIERIETHSTTQEEYNSICSNCEDSFQRMEVVIDGMLQELAEDGRIIEGTNARGTYSDRFIELISQWKKENDIQPYDIEKAKSIYESFDSLIKHQEAMLQKQSSIQSFVIKLNGISCLSTVATIMDSVKLDIDNISNLVKQLSSFCLPLIQPMSELSSEIKGIISSCSRLYRRLEDDFALSDDDRRGILVTGGSVIDMMRLTVSECEGLAIKFHDFFETLFFTMEQRCTSSLHVNAEGPSSEGPSSALLFSEDELKSHNESIEDVLLTIFQTFHRRLKEVYKSVQKGSLTDALTISTSVVSSDSTHSCWQVWATKIRSELSYSESLNDRLEESLEQIVSLNKDIRVSSREIDKLNVLKDKALYELDEEKTKVQELKKENKDLSVKLIKEREDLAKALSDVHKDKDIIEEENRSLKKKLRESGSLVVNNDSLSIASSVSSTTVASANSRSSRRSIGLRRVGSVNESDSTQQKVAEFSDMLSELEVQALRNALKSSRRSLSLAKSGLWKNEIDELGNLSSKVDSSHSIMKEEVASCRRKLKNLSKSIHELQLPKLVDLTSSTPAKEQLLQHKLHISKLKNDYQNIQESVQQCYSKAHTEVIIPSDFGDQEYLNSSIYQLQKKSMHVGNIKLPRTDTTSSIPSIVHVVLNHQELKKVQSILFNMM